MANRVLVNENSLADIAAAIREKTGNTEASFTPGQMGDAIRAIEANAEPVIEALSITVNGVYTAPEGLDGYNPITVEVPSKEPVVESIEIKANGTYTPSTGVDGFNEVVVDVPSSGGADLPEEAFNITGTGNYRFYYDYQSWLINMYGNKMRTVDLNNASQLFAESKQLEYIPFEINFKPTTSSHYMEKMFYNCQKLKAIPKINNGTPKEFGQMFFGCQSIREYPEDMDSWFNWSVAETAGMRAIFYDNKSLRKVPMDILRHGGISQSSYLNSIYYQAFGGCSSLDEIVGIPIPHLQSNWTSNAFQYTFDNCYRAKEITFEVQEDGTPYTINWKNQTIDLSKYVGNAYNYLGITGYNSGLTTETRVMNADDYARLKDNPDWFTDYPLFSRYNHTSAVNTINSLPITTGTGCSIKFKGGDGGLTDGGAISNLTEEEIAVAAAKGWTVSLVQEVSL